MPINLSDLGGGGGGAQPEIVYFGSGLRSLPYAGETGVYHFTIWSPTAGTSPSASLLLVNNDDETIGSGVFYDYDTGSTTNSKELYIRATEAFATIAIDANVESYVSIQFMNQYEQGTLVTTEVYSTSQSISFASPTVGFIVGGGGGGTLRELNQGGSGGGSGYLTFVDIPVGTHALVCGAGGAGGASQYAAAGDGGTTTFLGLSAAGGGGALSGGTTGGSGGSAGGSFYGTTGAVNGGTTGAGQFWEALGSGVTLPWWQAVPAAATDNVGGGLYGGGGGSTNRTGAGGGGVLQGGAGGSSSAPAGAGGTGGLVVLLGA